MVPVAYLAMAVSPVVASTYEQVLALPEDEFREKISLASYAELHGFCKHLKIFANGSKDEIIQRLAKHQEGIEGGEVVPKSPAGRAGRERAIRPGTAAAALRV